MSEQSCRTCSHFRPRRNPETGRALTSEAGKCAWPCPRKPLDKWPDVFRAFDGWQRMNKVPLPPPVHEFAATSSPRRISEAHRSKSPAKGYGAVTDDGVKQGGISGVRDNGKGDKWFQVGAARSGSKSNARKAASATIAKIPLPLARWIAKVWYPNSK